MSVYKCTAFKSGDGWKDNTKVGDVRYAYGYELPPPYAPGQFLTVGNPVWCAPVDQFRFEKLGFWRALLIVAPKLRRELRYHGRKFIKILLADHLKGDSQ